MASTTPRYAFPYQEATDSPAGDLVGQDLAEAVEDSLGDIEDALEAVDTALDARLDTAEADINATETVANAAMVRRAKTTATTNSSATSGTTELAVDQVTISAVNGVTYRIRWWTQWQGSVANDRHFLLLRLGSGTGGTQLTFGTVVVKDTAAAEIAVVEAEWTASSTASQTFTATMRRSSGTGTITANAAATAPRMLTVDKV
jgi:hypothetical protein